MLPSFITSEFDNTFESMNTKNDFHKKRLHLEYPTIYAIQKYNNLRKMYKFDTSCQRIKVQI